MLANAAASAILNVVVLALIPFLGYYLYHRRHGRTLGEVARRAGLQLGEVRYIGFGAAAAVLVVAAIVVWPPPLEPFLREGSPQRPFAGLGLSGTAVAMALLYGVVKTGFAEEFLFRGLIAGSLGRRLPLAWANLLQALIFLVPHLLILIIMPEMWWAMPIDFGGALFAGWVRIKSESILGPWMLHAAVNAATCLTVAMHTG